MWCVLIFDGACWGNQGGAGALLLQEGSDEVLWQGYRFCGLDVTKNEADYAGLLLGLQAVKAMVFDRCKPVFSLTVIGDSQVVARHMSGVHRCRSANLRHLYSDARAIETVLQCQIRYENVRRRYNWDADELANEALDTWRSWEQWGPRLDPPPMYYDSDSDGYSDY